MWTLEIIVMKCNGVAFMQFLLPVFLCDHLYHLASFLVSEKTEGLPECDSSYLLQITYLKQYQSLPTYYRGS